MAVSASVSAGDSGRPAASDTGTSPRQSSVSRRCFFFFFSSSPVFFVLFFVFYLSRVPPRDDSQRPPSPVRYSSDTPRERSSPGLPLYYTATIWQTTLPSAASTYCVLPFFFHLLDLLIPRKVDCPTTSHRERRPDANYLYACIRALMSTSLCVYIRVCIGTRAYICTNVGVRVDISIGQNPVSDERSSTGKLSLYRTPSSKHDRAARISRLD